MVGIMLLFRKGVGLETTIMKLVKDIGVILLLALLWFGTAYYAGAALLTSWGLQCGLVSLIVGLFGLAVINRTEEGRRLLYEG